MCFLNKEASEKGHDDKLHCRLKLPHYLCWPLTIGKFVLIPTSLMCFTNCAVPIKIAASVFPYA
jgi:hypothetical protein